MSGSKKRKRIISRVSNRNNNRNNNRNSNNFNNIRKVLSFKKMSKKLRRQPQLSNFIFVKSKRYGLTPLRKSKKRRLEKFIKNFKLDNDRLYYNGKQVLLVFKEF